MKSKYIVPVLLLIIIVLLSFVGYKQYILKQRLNSLDIADYGIIRMQQRDYRMINRLNYYHPELFKQLPENDNDYETDISWEVMTGDEVRRFYTELDYKNRINFIYRTII